MDKKLFPNHIYFRYINKHPLNDLIILDYGYENCSPNKPQIGPSQKPRCSLHFVVSGKGYFEIDGQTYEITANQIFIVPMHAITNYYPDRTDPWSYFWIGLYGSKTEQMLKDVGLTKQTPIYKPKDCQKIQDALVQLITLPSNINADFYSLSTYFYILNILFQEYHKSNPQQKVTNADTYVQYVLNYIENNYANDDLMNLKTISDQIFLNPIYLNRIFTQKIGLPIYSYLTQFRIQKACTLLEDNSLSIQSIAMQVGYSNPLYFSRIFKKYKNISPQKYREIIIAEARKDL